MNTFNINVLALLISISLLAVFYFYFLQLRKRKHAVSNAYYSKYSHNSKCIWKMDDEA